MLITMMMMEEDNIYEGCSACVEFVYVCRLEWLCVAWWSACVELCGAGWSVCVEVEDV